MHSYQSNTSASILIMRLADCKLKLDFDFRNRIYLNEYFSILIFSAPKINKIIYQKREYFSASVNRFAPELVLWNDDAYHIITRQSLQLNKAYHWKYGVWSNINKNILLRLLFLSFFRLFYMLESLLYDSSSFFSIDKNE